MRFRRTVGIILSLSVLSIPASAPAQVAAAGVAEIGKDLLDSGLIKDVFDLIVAHFQKESDIHCRLHKVYAALLKIESTREPVGKSLQARIDELKANSKAPADSAVAKQLVANVEAEEKALASFGKALEDVNVDLDVQSPKLSDALPRFVDQKHKVLQHAKNQIDLSALSALGEVKSAFDADTPNLKECHEQLRSLAKKRFPNMGDLSNGC